MDVEFCGFDGFFHLSAPQQRVNVVANEEIGHVLVPQAGFIQMEGLVEPALVFQKSRSIINSQWKVGKLR